MVNPAHVANNVSLYMNVSRVTQALAAVAAVPGFGGASDFGASLDMELSYGGSGGRDKAPIWGVCLCDSGVGTAGIFFGGGGDGPLCATHIFHSSGGFDSGDANVPWPAGDRWSTTRIGGSETSVFRMLINEFVTGFAADWGAKRIVPVVGGGRGTWCLAVPGQGVPSLAGWGRAVIEAYGVDSVNLK